MEIQVNKDLLNINTNGNEGKGDDSIDSIIKKFSNHPSILMINTKVNVAKQFEFSEATTDMVESELKKLNPKKATTLKNIPCKLLNSSYDVCAPTLTTIYNECVKNTSFPGKMKIADITPVHKKDDVTNVKNYRPISVLPSTSKVFERLMQSEINSFMSVNLSKYLCGYRKGYSAQYALISILEKWKSTLDGKELK